MTGDLGGRISHGQVYSLMLVSLWFLHILSPLYVYGSRWHCCLGSVGRHMWKQRVNSFYCYRKWNTWSKCKKCLPELSPSEECNCFHYMGEDRICAISFCCNWKLWSLWEERKETQVLALPAVFLSWWHRWLQEKELWGKEKERRMGQARGM